MSIQSGVGLSKNKVSSQAGFEAAKFALTQGKIDRPDFLFVFASSSFNQQELLNGIKEAAGNIPMVGCSTAGEITNEGPSVKSVAVMAIKSDSLKFYTGLGVNVKNGAKEAGKAVATEVSGKAEKASDHLRAFVMFPDVLTGNGADAVRGVLEILGEHFPLVGGAPGDDFEFKKSYEYRDWEVSSGAISGVGISGDFVMGAGVKHGWIPVGVPMKVTKSEGAVVHELDGKPAISIYEEYFGEKAEELRKEPLARMAITYPLGLKVPDYEEEYLIRDPITVDDKGSITCAAEIPEGSEVRLMIGSKDKAVEAAEDAASRLIKVFKDKNVKPKLVLMFNCIAREKLFAQKANDEIQAVLQIIGKDVPLAGFYTYGEQAPLGGELYDVAKINPKFYNETVVMFALG